MTNSSDQENYIDMFLSIKSKYQDNFRIKSYSFFNEINNFFHNLFLDNKKDKTELEDFLNIKTPQDKQIFDFICSIYYVQSDKSVPQNYWSFDSLTSNQQTSLIYYSLLNKKSNFYKKVFQRKLPFHINSQDGITFKEVLILSVLHHLGPTKTLNNLLTETFKDNPHFNKDAFIKILNIKDPNLSQVNLLKPEQIEIMKEIKIESFKNQVRKNHYIHQLPANTNLYQYLLVRTLLDNYSNYIRFQSFSQYKIHPRYLEKDIFPVLCLQLDLKKQNAQKDSKEQYVKLSHHIIEEYTNMHQKLESKSENSEIRRNKI